MTRNPEPERDPSEATSPGPVAREGLLILDKPEGPTSHDVVDLVRRALAIRRVGHTGTLDPLASGLLLVLLGRATRLARLLSGQDKTYEGAGQLGWSTNTYDRTGRPAGEPASIAGIEAVHLEAAAARLTGRLLQTPPPFSARKMGGEPLYRRARRGERVQPRPAPVTVHALQVCLGEGGNFTFTCRVSAGTYVRSLLHDLGGDLGCGAHLTALRRTGVGEFGLDRALDIVALRRDPPAAIRGPAFMPFDAIPVGLPVVRVGEEAMQSAHHGRPFPGSAGPEAARAPLVQVRSNDGRLVALAEPCSETALYRPRTVFPTP